MQFVVGLAGVVEQDELAVRVNVEAQQGAGIRKAGMLQLEQFSKPISMSPLERGPLGLLVLWRANLAGDELNDLRDVLMHLASVGSSVWLREPEETD